MRVGIIGLGARIASLMPHFQAAAPDLTVTGVADPSDDRMGALGALGHTPTRYDTAEQMLDQTFDMLMIGSPNHLHLDHLRQALQSDTPHIFAEKPLVITEDETLELARLAARHDGVRRVMVGLVLRYAPLYRALRQAQADGALGEIMSIEASEHIGPYHGSFFMRDWRRDSRLSGGFMLEKCCHDLDLYQGVVGARAMQIASFGGRKKYLPDHRPEAAPGYLAAMTPRWNGVADAFGGDGDIVDYQVGLVRYANGAALSFHTNLNVPDEFRRFAVIGRDGMAEGDFIRNTFRVTSSDSGAKLVDAEAFADGQMVGHYGADAAMASDVMDYVRGARDSLPLTMTDALEAGVTAMAMDRARAQGQIIDLAPFWSDFDAALSAEAA
ncbi:Gfo/Idh/MocA family oxidoreductase [Gymnodinialimonas sp. 2305UL16-5]|uniref:Gfo/Idh/MocA family protein n=1 Tax=Gymnodinialimonas mytili TaxID=3126503 RepID=UPI0030B5C730